jgi:hypothetical protein
MAADMLARAFMKSFHNSLQRTDQRQPYELESDYGNNSQSHPECWLRIQCHPEEALVRRSDHFSSRLVGLWRTLKDPVRVACRRIDFVPPS